MPGVRSEMKNVMTDNKTQVDFIVDGMTCASCVGRVQRTLKKFPEVVSANVN
ncbi:MAG: cation transporter, partial [Pseudomonadales bacterium]|nr:cation transporter [Pseudomonadales bacterium]